MNYHSARIHSTACVSPKATVIGDVEVGSQCTIFWDTTLRGDDGRIVVGARTNIQEGCILHAKVTLGEGVTVGHGAILHGCTIGDGTLVGMGSIVLDNAQVGKGCLIGAGSLVTGTARIPDGMLVLGSPAKAVRSLTNEEAQNVRQAAEGYVEAGRDLVENGLMVFGG